MKKTRLLKDYNIENILVVRNDRFGEFLLNIPVIVVLKENFPSARIVLIVKSEVMELAGRIPGVEEVISWDSPVRHTLGDKISFLKKIKNRSFDLAVILNPSKEFNIYTYLCGIPLRVGYNRKWGFLLSHKIKDKKYEGLRHEVDYNLDLLRAIGIHIDPLDSRFPLDIKPDDFSPSKMIELGITDERYVVLHPWASNKEKEWPVVKFKELAQRISLDLGLKLALIGGLEELSRGFKFCQGLTIANLTGKINLVELAAFLKRNRVLISNDSGPMHLAAVVGTPVAAIFRSSPASVSSKRWGPAGKEHVIIENDIIDNIRAEEVLNGVKKLLK